MQKVKSFSNKKINAILRTAPILKDLSDESIQAFSRLGSVKSYDKNETVFKQGEPSSDFYIILEGEVEILLETPRISEIERHLYPPKILNVLGEGEACGELTFQLDDKRSATAKSKGSVLFVCNRFELKDFCQKYPDDGLTFYINLATRIASIVSVNNKTILNQYLTNHIASLFRSLFEERDLEKSLITPSLRDLDIDEPANFLIGNTPLYRNRHVNKESLKISLFADFPVLSALISENEPNLGKIISLLLKTIRSQTTYEGQSITVKFIDTEHYSRGIMKIKKKNYTMPIYLEWYLKGIIFDDSNEVLTANIHIYVYSKTLTPAMAMEKYMAYIKIPIQQKVINLMNGELKVHGIGILVLHHRTLEVVNTMHNLQKLGYSIEGYIGIPYGNIEERLTHLLDYTSNHRYYTLRALNFAKRKTEYHFDFNASSMFHQDDENEIRTLFESLIEKSYLNSMILLVSYVLMKTIKSSLETKRPFVILEDGGYYLPLIYEAYFDSHHPLHELLVEAIDRKLILGIIEGTASGEVRDLNFLKQYSEDQQKLLPILSGARDPIKTNFESKGIAGSILQSSEVALRNLGLRGIEARKILVVGGNGAIGTRLIEQISQLQNKASNLFNLDLIKEPHHYHVEEEYKAIKQHSIYPTIKRYQLPDDTVIFSDLHDLLFANLDEKQKVILIDSHHLSKDKISKIAGKRGYRLVESIKHNCVEDFVFKKKKKKHVITVLSSSVILSFLDMNDAINHNIDTVIGVTGQSVFDETHLDTFLFRPHPIGTDDLVLISGSSKDNEFKKAILMLNELLIPAQLITEDQVTFSLNYFKQLHFNGLTLLSEPFFIEFFDKYDINSMDSYERINCYRLLKEKIGQILTIYKEYTTEVGSVYYINVNGNKKRVILLADGFVINFYATYAKGASLDYIDPILTLQLLGVHLLVKKVVRKGFHRISEELPSMLNEALWGSLEKELRR